MVDTEQKNGIIYCRVSSLEQVDGTSLESQERVCKEYAHREGISVSDVFIEKGESAKTADRTEFIRAINYCSQKKNNINYFIVYKLDRFARNQVDHISVRETLKKYKVDLRSVTEPIDNTPMGKMMEGILSTFAEFDNNIRTERSVNGMRERIKQGIWVWQAPLGYYRPVRGANIAPDPKTAPFIQLLFEEYAKKIYTYKTLADFLNKRGFRAHRDVKIYPQLVEKILKNPIYCGIIRVWEMERKGSFDPIIDEKLFYQCQVGGKGIKEIFHVSQNPNFPLRKLVICKSCSQPLTGSFSRGRKGIRYPYYHHHKQSCGYAKSIPKESFEQLFVEYLQQITPSFEFEKLFKSIVVDIWKNNYVRFNKKNDYVRKQVQFLEQERLKIFEFHRSGVYSDKEFVEQKNILSQKIAEKELLLRDTRVEEFNMEEALEYCFSFVRDTARTWLKLEKEPEKRLRFQKLIFEENIEFLESKFGTTKLTPIYRLYQSYLRDASCLVTPMGFEPMFQE